MTTDTNRDTSGHPDDDARCVRCRVALSDVDVSDDDPELCADCAWDIARLAQDARRA